MHPDLERLIDLSGRVALVTGGSRGLGRAMALGFAKAGASVASFGRLDIVVNNAATVLDRSLETITPDTFAGAFNTNLLGPLLLVQAAAPHLAPHNIRVNAIMPGSVLTVDGGQTLIA